MDNKKSYIALADLEPCTLVIPGAEEGTVRAATSGKDNIIGVTDKRPVKKGEVVDVALFGIAPVKFAGTVAAGGYFTSDANGKAVAVKEGDNAAGYVLNSAAAECIEACLLARSSMPTSVPSGN